MKYAEMTDAELDAEVAKRLGWKKLPYLLPDPKQPGGRTAWCPPREKVHISTIEPIPSWSTDIAAAMGLVADLDWSMWQQYGQYRCRIYATAHDTFNPYVEAAGETPSRTVCIAYLARDDDLLAAHDAGEVGK